MEIVTMNQIAMSLTSLNDIVATIGDPKYTTYCRSLGTTINRRILSEQRKFDSIYRLVLAINNAVAYYSKWMNKSKGQDKIEVAKKCLVSIYMITKQVGCTKAGGDSFESDPLFADVIDIDDWTGVTDEVILKCDLRIGEILIMEKYGNSKPECQVLFLNSAIMAHNFL